MKLTKERREELTKACEYARLAGCTYVDPSMAVDDAAELRALLATAEMAEVLEAEVEALRREVQRWNEVDVTRVLLRKLAAAQCDSFEAKDRTNAAAARLGYTIGGKR